MSTTAPIGGSVEVRIRDLVNEVFDAGDLAAAVLTPVLKARSAAFLVLAHAEIEYALEQECYRTAGLLRGAAEPATAMLAWGFTSLKAEGNITKTRKKPLDDLVDVYEHVVNKNNGIKARNLETLLWPLGVDLDSVKTDVLTLDAFGARRGDLAHQPLSNWRTTDLPSVHTRSAIQAGRSTDQLILAIKTGHSRVAPAAVSSMNVRNRVRRRLSRALKQLASAIDIN